jgi:DNA-binding transcriptional ArsR family regulator
MRMNEDNNIRIYDESNHYIDLAVNIFSLLADATRVRIILVLKEKGEIPVGEIANRLNKSQTAISQHLAKMRLSKLVRARREGTNVYYRLMNEHAYNLVAQAIFQGEHINDRQPTHHAVDG